MTVLRVTLHRSMVAAGRSYDLVAENKGLQERSVELQVETADLLARCGVDVVPATIGERQR